MVNFTRGFTKGGMWCDRDLLLFDRTRLGRVRRGPFWLTMAAYVLLYAAAFVIPFEIGYRLEVEPDSLYMKIFLNTWMLGFFVSIIPVVRMTRRRLHDAGFSGSFPRWGGRRWRFYCCFPRPRDSGATTGLLKRIAGAAKGPKEKLRKRKSRSNDSGFTAVGGFFDALS